MRAAPRFDGDDGSAAAGGDAGTAAGDGDAGAAAGAGDDAEGDGDAGAAAGAGDDAERDGDAGAVAPERVSGREVAGTVRAGTDDSVGAAAPAGGPAWAEA